MYDFDQLGNISVLPSIKGVGKMADLVPMVHEGIKEISA